MQFKDRVYLSEMYLEWIKENNILDCPLSVICFLDEKGFLKNEM